MKVPDKIYISPVKPLEGDDLIGLAWPSSDDSCEHTEYIRKNALLEWAKERYQQTISNCGCYTGHSVWEEVIEHIEAL